MCWRDNTKEAAHKKYITHGRASKLKKKFKKEESLAKAKAVCSRKQWPETVENITETNFPCDVTSCEESYIKPLD